MHDRLVRCVDPDCSVVWAFRDPPREHWHPRPHGPDWSVFGLVDADIVTEPLDDERVLDG